MYEHEARSTTADNSNKLGFIFSLPKPVINNKQFLIKRRGVSTSHNFWPNHRQHPTKEYNMKKMYKISQQSFTTNEITKIIDENVSDKQKMMLLKQSLYNKYRRNKTDKINSRNKQIKQKQDNLFVSNKSNSKIQDGKLLSIIVRPRKRQISTQTSKQICSNRENSQKCKNISLPHFSQQKIGMYYINKNSPKKTNKTLPIHMLYNTIFTQIGTENILNGNCNEQVGKQKLKLSAQKMNIGDHPQNRASDRKHHEKQMLKKLDTLIQLKFEKYHQNKNKFIPNRTRSHQLQIRGWDQFSPINQQCIFPQSLQ